MDILCALLNVNIKPVSKLLHVHIYSMATIPSGTVCLTPWNIITISMLGKSSISIFSFISFLSLCAPCAWLYFWIWFGYWIANDCIRLWINVLCKIWKQSHQMRWHTLKFHRTRHRIGTNGSLSSSGFCISILLKDSNRQIRHKILI